MLLGLGLWTFGSHLVWALLDTLPPGWDPGVHLHLAFKYWQVLTVGSERLWFDLLNVEPFYPPLYHLSLLPAFAVLGFSTDTAVLVNALYLAVMFLATYAIGRRIYDRPTGLLAAFLIASYPFLAKTVRRCLIDTLLAAAVTLAYFLFLKSRNFEDRKYSTLFSLVFAAGLMVKWTFFIYLLPAVALGLAGSETRDWKTRGIQAAYYLGMILALLVLPFLVFIGVDPWGWAVVALEGGLVAILVRAFPASRLSPEKVINLVTLTLVSVLVCFPWYAHNLIGMSKGILKFGLTSQVLMPETDWGLPVWGFYLESLNVQMGLPLVLLMGAGGAVFLAGRKNFNGLLLAWVGVPLLVMTLLKNKDHRYILPLLPPLALMTSLAVTRIARLGLRRAVCGLTLGVGLFSYLYAGFLPGNWEIPGIGGPLLGEKMVPRPENWRVDEILDDIVAAGQPPPGQTLTVRTMTYHRYFQRGAFRDRAEIRGLPVDMKSVKRNVGEMTDFFIIRNRSLSDDSGVEALSPKKNRLLQDPALQNTFTLFRTYPLPDGTRALVYQKRVVPAKNLKGAENLQEVGRRLIGALEHYPIYGFKNGQNVRTVIVPTSDPEDIFLGRYAKIAVTADSVVSNKVLLKNFELVFENVQINLYDLFLNDKLIFFEIGRLFPRATLPFGPLEELADKELKGQGKVRLAGQDEAVTLHAWYDLPSWTIKGEARLSMIFEPGVRLRPHLDYLILGPVSVPEIFTRRLMDEEIRMTPTSGWPLHTEIRSVRIGPRHLALNPPSG